jgi:hypothetical protein
MEKDMFVERMLEIENLTDELEDDQANWLLNWGISRLDQVLQGAADAEAGGDKANALIAVMRKINRMTGARGTAGSETLADDLSALSGLFSAAFGKEYVVTAAECSLAAARLAKLSPQQAVEYLAAWGFQSVDRT